MFFFKQISSVIAMTCCLTAYAASDPKPMIEDINQQVIAVLKKNQTSLKSHPHIIEKAIHQYFIPHVDTLGMSRSVLGRTIWQSASAQERTQFSQEFTQLVLRTYAQPLSSFNDEKVEFLPKSPITAERFTQVKTVIVRPNGQRIAMTYHLVMMAGGEWKVYDLSVEGVSLLNSFRNQFGQVLKEKDLATVIAKMHEKNKQRLS